MSTLSGLFYLNKNGSRWVVFENGKRVRRIFETKSGVKIERSVNYFSAWGNFATANISYKGRRVNVFTDTILED